MTFFEKKLRWASVKYTIRCSPEPQLTAQLMAGNSSKIAPHLPM
jgi:hypothetical protein